MLRRTADGRLADELSQRGLRATRQRLGVLRLLRGRRTHLTAAELHDRLVRELPNLSQKTVYEVLDALVGVGLASRVTEGGEPYRYEARVERHYHACCRRCGRLDDVPAHADRQIRDRTPLPRGFRMEEVQVTIHGLCSRCRSGR